MITINWSIDLFRNQIACVGRASKKKIIPILPLNSLEKATLRFLHNKYQHSSLMNGRVVECVGKHVHILAALTKNWGITMAGHEQ